MLKSVSALGFEKPTPIQSEAIPLILKGRDLMGLAQTGTGKTAAFGLPLVQNLIAANVRPGPKSVRALILAPTRELVNQIADNLRTYVRGTPLRIGLVVGGVSIGNQIRSMSRGADILVATPGRLIDLVDRRAVILESARFLVLDEADQMLDLGFINALRRLAKCVGQPRQTLLFSATMPKQMDELSRAFLTDPARVQITPPGSTVEEIRQSVHFTGQRSKVAMLHDCLAERPEDLSLVFVRTKHGAEKLMKGLVHAGFSAGSIHGNKSQGQRQRAIAAFRSGEIRVLVATDVAARGIDIPGVSHVYNFDLPEVPESYVHRIGRTARAGAAGEAVAFCGPADMHLLRDIERLMGLKIAVASGDPDTRDSYGKPQGRGSKPRSVNGGGNRRHSFDRESGSDAQAHRYEKPRHSGKGASGQKSGQKSVTRNEGRPDAAPFRKRRGPKKRLAAA